jgi:hypothetical protein
MTMKHFFSKLRHDFVNFVFPSRQDRKTNSFVCFLEEATASTDDPNLTQKS